MERKIPGRRQDIHCGYHLNEGFNLFIASVLGSGESIANSVEAIVSLSQTIDITLSMLRGITKTASSLYSMWPCGTFDGEFKLVTSYLFSPFWLASVRLLFALFIFSSLAFNVVWVAVTTDEIDA